MLEAQPDFDPHNLSHGGANTPKHGHVNAPYVYQEYPKVLYKTVNGKQLSATVLDAAGEQSALADGYGEPVTAAPTAKSAISAQSFYSQVVITDESGEIIGYGEKEKITLTLVDEQTSVVYEGSGSERWPDNDWTQAGDGTTYPAVPSQAEADSASQPEPVHADTPEPAV